MDSWKQSISVTATYYENLPHCFVIFFLADKCLHEFFF